MDGAPVYSNTMSSQSDPFSIQETLTAGDTVDFVDAAPSDGRLSYIYTGPAVSVASNALHWVAGSGNFNTAADWNPQQVPGATGNVVIDAVGTYPVTASTNETMNTLAVAANATLVVSAGTFSVNNGSAADGLAGSIIVDAGAVLALGGVRANTGTIAGGGQLGGGTLAFSNSSTVSGSAAAALTIDLGSGHLLQNQVGGLIEATGTGGLTIASGSISNAGTMLATSGSTLTFQSGVVNLNNTGGVLKGGTWKADGNGSTFRVSGGAVGHDNAAIILSGAGSVFSAGDGSSFTNLQASLGGVSPFGTLELDAGASFTATKGIGDYGMIQLGGGTLTLPRLAVGVGGHVRGFGTIKDTRYALSNAGTIEANDGKLAIASAVDPASSGLFRLDASSLLEIAADQGAADRMNFLGTGGELVIDAAESRQRGVQRTAGGEFRHGRSSSAEERRAGGTDAGV